MPARSRANSPCCEGKSYTTEHIDPVTGNTLWRSNFFNSKPGDWNANKYVCCEYLYEYTEDGIDKGIIFVGGVRSPNKSPLKPSVTWRTVAAFDWDTGKRLWERDTVIDCVGYDSDHPSDTPDTVMQIQKDSEGNFVCMMRRFNSAGGGVADYFYHEDAHWITLDVSGNLIDAKTFTRQNNYVGNPITAIGFDIDSSGFYHIAGVDYDGDAGGSIRGGSEYQHFYGWSSFGSPPTLYEVALSGGTPYKCTPSSLVRYADKDWMGGRSTANPGGPSIDSYASQFLTGALIATDANLIDEWSDVGETLSKRHSFFDTDEIQPTGISQGSAQLLTNNANNVMQQYQIPSLTPIPGYILPDGVQGDVVTIDPYKVNYGAGLGSDHLYVLYPPVGARLILDFLLYVPNVDGGIGVGSIFFKDFLHTPFIKCTCMGEDAEGISVWLVENCDLPIVCNMPFPGNGLNYTVGRYGVIVHWLDGDVYKFTDCDRVQAIADSDGNTYGTGSLTGLFIADTPIAASATISKRDLDGTLIWAHKHTSSFTFNQARMLHLSSDESRLFVSGSGAFGGPKSIADDVNFVEDYCDNPGICHGNCEYLAEFDEEVNIDATEGSYVFRCHASVEIEAWAGGGGGGGSIGFDKGGGGGGQGQHFWAVWFVLAGTILSWSIDPSSTGEGQGGDDSGIDGRDGANLRVATALTNPLFILQGGYGGKGTNNAPDPHPGDGGFGGGGPGGFAADGEPGDTDVGGNGGGFGFTGGDSGKGATSNALGLIDGAVAGGQNGGGGGGGSRSGGADGGPQHLKMKITYLKWAVNPDPGNANCQSGCDCRDPDDMSGIFVDQFGCPFDLTSTLTVRCAGTPTE